MTWDQFTDDVATWAQDPVVIAVAVGVVLLLALLVVYLVRRRRQRRASLERQYGAEYDRTVQTTSRREAENDLEDRTRRHRDIEVRWLTQSERDRYRARFETVQASFIDSPDSAVLAADGLIDEVAVARGYPDGGERNRRLSDISVDYPDEVAAHRRGLAQLSGGEERPTTEQQRKSLLAARTLFDRLVGVGDDVEAPEPPESLATAPTGTDDDAMRDDAPDTARDDVRDSARDDVRDSARDDVRDSARDDRRDSARDDRRDSARDGEDEDNVIVDMDGPRHPDRERERSR